MTSGSICVYECGSSVKSANDRYFESHFCKSPVRGGGSIGDEAATWAWGGRGCAIEVVSRRGWITRLVPPTGAWLFDSRQGMAHRRGDTIVARKSYLSFSLFDVVVVRDERYTTKSNLTQMSTGALRLAPSLPRASLQALPLPKSPRHPAEKERRINHQSINQSRRREKEGTISPCSSVMRRSLPRPCSSVLRPPWSVAIMSCTLLFHALHRRWK